MHDPAKKWSPIPDWPNACIEAPQLRINSVVGLEQVLVSGNLEAFCSQAGLGDNGVGAFGLALGERYSVRLARDRMLVVGSLSASIPIGWNPEEFAASPVSAALHVFEIQGASALAVARRGTSLDPRNGGPSAALLFAGVNAILYGRADGVLRLHVERTLAPYVWNWLEVTVAALPS